MNEKEVVSKLLDRKKVAVLRVLLNSSEEFCLKEIAQKSQVSMASTYRILRELMLLGIARKRVWKTSKVYSCEQHETVEFLKGLFEEELDGVGEFFKSVGSLTGVQQIILHGTRRKGRANVLVLGQGMDMDALEQARLSLKEKGFELSYVTLTPKQYEQMSLMGLYAGEKKVLRG